MKNQFRYVKLTDQLLFKTKFPKMHYNIRGSFFNSRHQAPQWLSVSQLGTSL